MINKVEKSDFEGISCFVRAVESIFHTIAPIIDMSAQNEIFQAKFFSKFFEKKCFLMKIFLFLLCSKMISNYFWTHWKLWMHHKTV